MKKRIKRTFSIHHWTGLIIGIFLLISSITGSVLVFHQEIDSVQFANLTQLKEPSNEVILDNSFEHIGPLYASSDIRVQHFPDTPDDALIYEIRSGNSRKWISTHPSTGQILGTVEQADKRLVHVLLNIHYNFLAGTPGKIIVLFTGIALIILSVTGFMLYRKAIFKVITFQQRISFKSRRSLFSSLHRIVGVWSLLFNLLISISGSWIAYTIVASALSATPISKSTPAGYHTISIDNALAEVKESYPELEVKYLRFANGKFYVMGKLKSDPAIFGRTASRVTIDMSSGDIENVSFLKDAPWYQKAKSMALPLHFGDYAGFTGKIIYSIFGMLPGILTISGFLIWRMRKSVKRRSRMPMAKPLMPISNSNSQ